MVIPESDGTRYGEVMADFLERIRQADEDYHGMLRALYFYEWRDNLYHSKIWNVEQSPIHVAFGLCDRDGQPKFDIRALLGYSTDIQKRWVGMHTAQDFPALISSEAELLEVMTRPDAALIDFIATLSSPLIILGAGGKMGPTLAVLAQRAVHAAGTWTTDFGGQPFFRSKEKRMAGESGRAYHCCGYAGPVCGSAIT